MAWHLEAVGSGGVRGTGDKKTMDLAAYLYKKVVENFTREEFAKFEFPRIVKDDWPTLYKIKYAMADLLYFQQSWEECGPAFDAVVAEEPQGRRARPKPRTPSVLCYQKMYDAMYKGTADRKGKGLGPTGADEKDRKAKKGEWEKFKPKPFTDLQKGMITAFNRYVCYIKPPKGDKDSRRPVRRGQVRPRPHLLRGAALGGGGARLPRRRAEPRRQGRRHLRRAALPRVAERARLPRRPAAADLLRRHGATTCPSFLKLYCEGKKDEDNKEQCELLTRIQFDIQRLRAQKIVELADSQQDKGNTQDALDNYKKGARRVPRACGATTAKARWPRARSRSSARRRRNRLQHGRAPIRPAACSPSRSRRA